MFFCQGLGFYKDFQVVSTNVKVSFFFISFRIAENYIVLIRLRSCEGGGGVDLQEKKKYCKHQERLPQEKEI